MLKFFMGNNTPERQQYIIRNLRFEHDIVDDDEASESEPLGAEDEESASQAA